jgi:glucokinase
MNPGPGGDQVLALDIGGTKLAAAVVDAEGAVHGRRQVPTRGHDAEALWGTVRDLVEDVRAAGAAAGGGPPRAVGVGSGGPMSAGGEELSPLNIPAWRGFPLKARLADHLGLPVFVDNDAKALALGEGWRGGARGERDYVAMVVSTGVGGGVVVDGRLLDGSSGNAGHIGHVVVEPDGRRCACGGQGCLEAEASGPSIERITGRPAAEADAATIARTGMLVGRAVASVAALLDLRLALVAGSVALGFGDAFFAAAQEEIDRRARLDYVRGTTIRPAGLGAEGPIIGAAAVAWRAVGRDIGVR